MTYGGFSSCHYPVVLATCILWKQQSKANIFFQRTHFWKFLVLTPRLPSVSSTLYVSFSFPEITSFVWLQPCLSQQDMYERWKRNDMETFKRDKIGWFWEWCSIEIALLDYTPLLFFWYVRLRKRGFNVEYYLLLNDFPPNKKNTKWTPDSVSLQETGDTSEPWWIVKS